MYILSHLELKYFLLSINFENDCLNWKCRSIFKLRIISIHVFFKYRWKQLIGSTCQIHTLHIWLVSSSRNGSVYNIECWCSLTIDLQSNIWCSFQVFDSNFVALKYIIFLFIYKVYETFFKNPRNTRIIYRQILLTLLWVSLWVILLYYT